MHRAHDPETSSPLPAGLALAPGPGGRHEDPDVELMLRARERPECFEALFHRHAGPLTAYAHRRVQDWGRAEDLVQETFLRIYRARDRYEPRSRFSTYVYRVLTNLCLNEIRRPKRWHVPLEDLDDPVGPPRPDRPVASAGSPPGPEDLLIERQRLGSLQSVMSRLPGNQQRALLLARVEKVPYAEIAVRLGISLSAVKSLVSRASASARLGFAAEEAGAGAARRT